MPLRVARGFPGNREDAYRAGIRIRAFKVLIGIPQNSILKGKKLPPQHDFGQACYSIFMNTTAWQGIFRLKYLIIFIGILLSPGLSAEDFRKTVITDPSISRRCNELMRQRQQKIDHKQKIRNLLQRSKRLIQLTPPERKTIMTKLKKNYKSLSHELRLTLNQIQNKEENIIRKGCPGIKL